MSVPSKPDFESFFETAKWKPSQELLRKAETITFNEDALIDFYLSRDKEELLYFNRLTNHMVFNWLWNQQSCQRAFAKKKPKKRTQNNALSTEDCARALARYLLKELEEGRNRLFPNEKSVRSSIIRDMYREDRSALFWRNIVRGFYNYFYTDRAEKLHAMYKEFEALRKHGKKLADQLRTLFLPLNQDEADLFTNGRPIDVFLNNNERTAFRIESFLTPHGERPPVSKNDSTLKERVLVFDLYQAFMCRSRRARATAIFHLMMIEGVKHNFEHRTIERWLKAFREEREKAKQTHARMEEERRAWEENRRKK